METYEQKYKEALTWIESIYHELSHDRQMEAEAFFHELKESEDEKIRKEILSFCQGRADNYPNAPMYGNIRKWIAWLEKQGEQNPAKNIVETWKEMRLEVYQQASGNRHEPNYSDDTTKMFSLNDIDEIIEKITD